MVGVSDVRSFRNQMDWFCLKNKRLTQAISARDFLEFSKHFKVLNFLTLSKIWIFIVFKAKIEVKSKNFKCFNF
jgi:hypothetical protein